MKRLTALLLAALLALTALPALAADYPIEEKFYRQIVESAFQGTLTFSASGGHTDAIDDVTWALIKSLAPRLTLTGDHSLSRGEGQATLQLLLDGQEAGKTTYLYHDTLMGLSSDLLAGQDVFYTVAKDWDISRLFQSALQGDSAWPSLWRVLYAVQSAPAEWQERAAPYLTPYETKLGVWMNSYATFSTGNQENVAYTELKCVIPPQAVKAQIKQMLVDFYADAELLTLLREVLTAQEAAAYLQPGMQNSFFAMLDALSFSGDVEIIRRYDAHGNALLDSIFLPFAKGQQLSDLTIALTPDEGGQRWAAAGKTATGADFDLSCVVGADFIYTGSVSILLPAGEENASFVVSDTGAQRQSVGFDFNLSWDPGEEAYTLATDRFERTVKGTLVVKPREGSALPAQSLTLEAVFSSGSSQRSATRLNAALTWTDLESDAAITATLESRTAAPWTVDSLQAVTGALRVDLMEDEGRAALVKRWGETTQAWFQNLLARLAPALSATGTGL